MNKLNNFSASQLVKKSANFIYNSSLIDYKNKIKQPLSDFILSGIKHQNNIIKSFKNAKDELRGEYINDDIRIYFCNDLYSNDKLYEIKSINGKYTDNYLQKSLLQVAFYKSMIIRGSNLLVTPSFKLNEGFEKEEVIISNKIKYYLLFGNIKYKINVNNSKEIINFYLKKAKASLNKETSKLFDYKYENKEFNLLKNYFSYRIVNNEKRRNINIR